MPNLEPLSWNRTLQYVHCQDVCRTEERGGFGVEHIVNKKNEIETQMKTTHELSSTGQKRFMCLFCRKHLNTSQSISPSVCLHNAIPTQIHLEKIVYAAKSEHTKADQGAARGERTRTSDYSSAAALFLVSCSSTLPAGFKVTSGILPFGASNS